MGEVGMEPFIVIGVGLVVLAWTFYAERRM